MAEGRVRLRGQQVGDGWQTIESAGIEAHGKNPRASSVIQEAGVDISGQETTRLTIDMLQRADLIVSACGHADEHCPVLPAGTGNIHWPLDHPAKTQ